MQRVNTWPIARLTSVRVAQLFMLLMSPWMLELVSCEEGSGGSGCRDAVNQLLPLSSPDPTSQQISGLFLSSLGTCGGGVCVSGWSYCYYSPYGNEESSATVIFSLWRWSEGGTLKEVNGSKFSVDMETLPEGQWLACEERELGEGCGVEMEEGDLVGVFINQNTSLHILGEVDGGRVMVGSVEDRERGSVSNSSLARQRDTSLLVTPNLKDLSFCSDAAQEECSGDPTSTPTRGSPRVPSPAEGIPGLELLVVSAGLSLIVLVLLTLLCFFLCVLRRKSRSLKRGTTSTVVLNSHRQHSDVGTEHDVEMHILDTGSSTHSTSLSPTPNGTARVWQVDHRKTPPPIKPKPRHLSSRKTPQPQVRVQTPPLPPEGVVIPSEPAHHASLLRSYSEEAIQLQPRVGLPRSLRFQRRLSTGSLPTPYLDEDDYTIPSSFSRCSHLRPQPYLQPRMTLEYAYAYSHVLRTGVVTGRSCTVPRTRAAVVPPLHSQLVRSEPPKASAFDEVDDYDEIFVDQYWQEMRTNQSRHPPSSSDHTSSISEQPRLMSTGSEGYMNSDEFPRPSIPVVPDTLAPNNKPHPLGPSGSPDKHQPLQRHYAPLQISMRRMSSSYEVPRSGSLHALATHPLPRFSSDYDHLDSDQS